MKYIITEKQYNLILESQKYVQVFQELIDEKLVYIRQVCDRASDEYEGDVGHESCNQIESIEKIEVLSAEWFIVKHSNKPKEEKILGVKVMIYYSSLFKGEPNFDDLIYDLRQIIRKPTGIPFVLNYESTNTRKDFNW